MKKHTQNSKLECTQTQAGLGRKSLLACAVLAMMVGGNAWADVIGATSADEFIIINNDQGIGGSQIVIDAGSTATITVEDQVAGTTTIEGGKITAEGTVKAGSITSENSVSAKSFNANGGLVSNVGDGVADTDAINKRQLDRQAARSDANLNAYSKTVDARFHTLGKRIDDVAERAYAGVASVAALAAIPAPAAGKRFSVGMGAGNYSSENAVAVGFRAALTESTSMTAGVSRNTASKTVTNVGVGYSW